MAITRIIVTATGEIRVDLSSRDAALDALARHLGMFKQQVALTGPNGEPILPIEAVRALIWERSNSALTKSRGAVFS